LVGRLFYIAGFADFREYQRDVRRRDFVNPFLAKIPPVRIKRWF
jgi:hypothetical protein